MGKIFKEGIKASVIILLLSADVTVQAQETFDLARDGNLDLRSHQRQWRFPGYSQFRWGANLNDRLGFSLVTMINL
jgi:hypothetical protein